MQERTEISVLAGTTLQMFKKVRPYNLLGIAGLLLFAISFMVPVQSVDIQVHDSYYVFEMSFAFRNTACILLVLFTICSFLKHTFYSITLSWIHAVLTILTALLCILFLYKATKAYQPHFSDWSTFQTNNNTIVLTIMTFLLTQVLFVVNLLVGAFKATKQLR